MTHTDTTSAHGRPPLAVWACGPARGQPVPERLAQRLVHEYTQRGDTTADLTGTGLVADQAARAGRASEVVASTSSEHEEEVAWADLMVAALPAIDEPARVRKRRARAQMAFAAMITRPGGIIATITPVGHAPDGSVVDPAPGLVRAAACAGLVYLQHVVALTAPICEAGLGSAIAVRDRDFDSDPEEMDTALPVSMADAAATITSPAHLNVSVFRIPKKGRTPAAHTLREAGA